ncbi:hypothetical protein ACF0H5_009142 [Mactra antiquata]
MTLMETTTYSSSDVEFTNETQITDWLNQTESLEALNARYAGALLPLTVTFGVFVLLGFLGNLIILLVFTLSRDYRRNNFKIFVLTLGVIDIITCVTLIPAEMIKQRHYFAFGDVASCKAKCFFNVFGAAASCLALLVISIDRYRKVVQPFKKQMTPKLAMKLLFVVAFIFPVLLAIPGTIMCGIKRTSMKNINGGVTTINLCETEEKFRFSIWRSIYKFTFIILLVGISFTYVVLYVFVMKEAIKQIRAIARLRKNSAYEVTYSSDVFDPNSVNADAMNRLPRASNVDTNDIGSVVTQPLTSKNGSLTRKDRGTSQKKASRQYSMRSVFSQTPLTVRQRFPTKTLVWFILTLIFIITYMTHLILALKVAGIVAMTPSEFAWFSFCYRIYFFNHMINPLIYAIFVKKFRTSCSTLLPTLRDKIKDCFS